MDLTDFLGGKKTKTASASGLPGRDEVGGNIHWGSTGLIDEVLQNRLAKMENMRSLLDTERKKNALQLPVEAGTRVQFMTNLGSVMSYEDIPGRGVLGTVVTVRSAHGDVTAFQERVHVLWDDGKFRAIQAEHLRSAVDATKRASSKVRISFSTMSDLSEFFEPRIASGSDLIHKATKDLWSFAEKDGQYVIERLFTEDGNPLKV